MTRHYDTNGYREVGKDQPHARTELRTDDGRTFSINGIGEEVRAALIKHAEGAR